MMNNRLFSIFSEIYESERFDASQSLQSGTHLLADLLGDGSDF
jgi:hypothetical protein